MYASTVHVIYIRAYRYYSKLAFSSLFHITCQMVNELLMATEHHSRCVCGRAHVLARIYLFTFSHLTLQ